MRDDCSALPMRKPSTRRIRVPEAALPRDTARVEGHYQRNANGDALVEEQMITRDRTDEDPA